MLTSPEATSWRNARSLSQRLQQALGTAVKLLEVRLRLETFFTRWQAHATQGIGGRRTRNSRSRRPCPLACAATETPPRPSATMAHRERVEDGILPEQPVLQQQPRRCPRRTPWCRRVRTGYCLPDRTSGGGRPATRLGHPCRTGRTYRPGSSVVRTPADERFDRGLTSREGDQ